MKDQIVAKRVSVPTWTRSPTIYIDEDCDGKSRDAFQSHFDDILNHLHNDLTRSFNDSSIFFLSDDEGFPIKQDLSGEYYVSDITYEHEELSKGETFTMWIVLHCLCRQEKARGEDRDYVSMEMIVYLDAKNRQLEYEPEFQWAAI